MKKLVSKRGVALLLVLMSMALLVVLLVEILFASRVDLRIGGNSRNRLQAIYLAQSASRFALLRLHFYKVIQNMKNSNNMALPINQTMIDAIWNQALPMVPLATQKVSWPGQFSAVITSEGSKIPINLLDGNIHRNSDDKIQQEVEKQILALIKGHLEDEEFGKLYRDLRPEELVENLRDWIDSDNVRISGGDESADYEKANPPYQARNDRMPNLSELAMVKGWSDDWVKKLSKDFSVINNRLELNPNFVSLSRLKAIHPLLTDEDLQAINKRRNESPFKDLAEMESFITTETALVRNGRGFSFKNYKSALSEKIFYIESVGVVGEARRTLKLGVVFGTEKTTPAGGSSTSSSSSSSPDADKAKLADPNIVSAEEVL